MQLLIDHEESIAPDSKDPIHEILKDLGPSPSIEALVGESALFLNPYAASGCVHNYILVHMLALIFSCVSTSPAPTHTCM